MTILPRTLHYAEILGKIPNAPYLYGPMLERILAMLHEMGISEQGKSRDFTRGVYAIDDYCLYVKFKRGRASRPVLVDSHLDHPSFVLDGAGHGVAFGSVGLERIRNLLQAGPIDLRVFAPSGEPLGIGQMTDLNVGGKPIITINTPKPVPANSHALWNVTDFEVSGENLYMHSADNLIVTAVMMALIEQVAKAADEYRDIDVTFVFTFLEEIFELSATAVAMRGRTPFDTLDQSWLIMVLESMEAIPLAPERQLVSAVAETEDSLKAMRAAHDNYAVAMRSGMGETRRHAIYEKLTLPEPDAYAGAVIKINDMDCVYGYEFPDSDNLAENLLLNIADELKLTVGHTVYGGACNGTAFSLFPTSSHIATLSVPNPHKHNLDFGGTIVPEQVKIAHIDAVGQMMIEVLRRGEQGAIADHGAALSKRLKKTSLMPTAQAAKKLRAERGTIAWAAKWRLHNKRYFNETVTDKVAFNLRGLMSRLREPVARIIG